MGVILAAAVVSLAAIILAGHRYSNWWTARLITSRHKDIEELFETGEIPKRWAKPERKLLALMRYVRGTRLMADEETRKEVYARLEDILSVLRAETGTRSIQNKEEI